jgi:hypothetical protein
VRVSSARDATSAPCKAFDPTETVSGEASVRAIAIAPMCRAITDRHSVRESESALWLDDQISGSMQVRTLSRKYPSSRIPYARRWITRILLFRPSTKPSGTLFSGLQ